MTAMSRTLARPPTQREKADPAQVKNSAGGYVFTLKPADALERFIVLGTEGGTYYASERDLTQKAMLLVKQCVSEMDAVEYRDLVIRCAEVARKRSYALWAISEMLVSGDDKMKLHAEAAAFAVCKTGTDVFELASYIRGRRGWGETVKHTFDKILLGLPEDKLALWAVKYRDRFGFTWRDLLRLQHTKAETPTRDAIFNFMTTGSLDDRTDMVEGIGVIRGYIIARGMGVSNEAETIRVVNEYRLPWEALTDEQRTDDVWKACVPNIGDNAVLRNVASFTRRGLDKDFTFRQNVSERIARSSKLHPVQVLDALKTYTSGGRVGRSKGGTYTPQPRWTEGMEDALDRSFIEGVNKTGQRIYVGLDVSGSMTHLVSGSFVLSCREVGAAIALGMVKAEDEVAVFGFCDGNHRGRRATFGNYRDNVVMQHLPMNKRTPFVQAMEMADRADFGGTDCALPMLHALDLGVAVDTFIVITDNETWAGKMHPMEALRKYRQKSGINAKLAVVGLTATNFTIADPKDPGTMDFVGFSSDLPRSIEKFMTMA